MVQKVLGNLSRGICFVVSAPAGTGKTTLARKLIDEFDSVALSVSSTTRKARPGEIADQDYHFLTTEEFEERINKRGFLEYAKVFGNYYGTSKQQVEDKLAKGQHVILVIDTQGAVQLRDEGYRAVFVFISPPSLDELKQRLINRKTDSPASIEERLSWARQEMTMADHYDYHIINDDLDTAYDVLRSILIAEEHKLMQGV